MDPILIILGVLVLVFAIGYVVSKVGGAGPDEPTPDDSGPAQGSERSGQPEMEGYPPGARPADPGAEAMNADQPGDPMAGTPTDESAAGEEIKPSDAARKPLEGDA